MIEPVILFPSIAVLLVGFVCVYLTSTWSPISTVSQSVICWLGIVIAYLAILPALAQAKSVHTFLIGEGKPGMFFWWGFGVWFSLSLLRKKPPFVKVIGIISTAVFGILVTTVISEELRLVFGN